ncbi:MAG: nucleotidyltransferase family protein [Alphaproteobacteria bacterium]|nr:nucleotidyltransferase family protein [Alphaproteobacteria bacterium]
MSRHHAGKGERPDGHGNVGVTVFVPPDKAEAVKGYARRISRRRAPARREDIVEILNTHREHIERFGVRALSLFGSVVRGEAKPHSDVDLLVEFEPGTAMGLFGFVELKNVLEGLLGRPVDLITDSHIKPRIRTRVMSEARLVFGPDQSGR